MPKEKKELFRMKLVAESTDKKTRLFEGHLGNTSIGTVSAASQTAAKKKLLALARKRLK